MMDNRPGIVPKILLEVPHDEGDAPRRRSHSLSRVQDEEENERTTKKRSLRKTLTRTWSKRVSFRSKSIEIRSAPNGSPVKTSSDEQATATNSEATILRVRGRSRERRCASMDPNLAAPREPRVERPACISLLVPRTTETAALFPVDNRPPVVHTGIGTEEVTVAAAAAIPDRKHCTSDVGAGDDLEDVRQHLDPALLNGSSGNFGSAGARSAPSTPQTTTVGPPLLADSCNTGSTPPNSLPRSPSHNIFSKTERGNLKQLSTSAPIMTAQPHSPDPPSPKSGSHTKDVKPLPYKARQKKFHRHFPAALEDDVLNYYSCALISDILLQGHLYITKNYFAFYSNVFGYVTKLLIPMQSVTKITKERTARIIPNAVGITTCEDKHVFGSLISRDATYKYMNEVWETAKKELCDDMPSPPPSDSLMEHPSDDLSESSETREESGRESASDITSRFRKCANKTPDSYSMPEGKLSKDKQSDDKSSLFRETYLKFASANRQNLLLYVTTFILIVLFLSAAVLLYRIGQVQNRYTQALQDNFVLSDSDDVYGELLQWQTHLHSKSAGAVHSFLDTNLDQIAKVRQSLEALSTLLIPNSAHGASSPAAASANPIDTDNS